MRCQYYKSGIFVFCARISITIICEISSYASSINHLERAVASKRYLIKLRSWICLGDISSAAHFLDENNWEALFVPLHRLSRHRMGEPASKETVMDVEHQSDIAGGEIDILFARDKAVMIEPILLYISSNLSRWLLLTLKPAKRWIR